jgi:hypothetical protein
VVELLPSKNKALSSIPSTTGRKEGRKEGRKKTLYEQMKVKTQFTRTLDSAKKDDYS